MNSKVSLRRPPRALPDTLEEPRSPDLGAIVEFHELLGSDQFREFLAEIIDAFETKSHPSALWAKWIDVVVERTPPPEIDGPTRSW